MKMGRNGSGWTFPGTGHYRPRHWTGKRIAEHNKKVMERAKRRLEEQENAEPGNQRDSESPEQGTA